jgi:hypothetical protein
MKIKSIKTMVCTSVLLCGFVIVSDAYAGDPKGIETAKQFTTEDLTIAANKNVIAPTTATSESYNPSSSAAPAGLSINAPAASQTNYIYKDLTSVKNSTGTANVTFNVTAMCCRVN